MKNLDQFIAQMMASARMVQARDMSSATDTIQKALAQAGLGVPQASAATATATADDFVDLVDINPAPEWNKRPQARQARPKPERAARPWAWKPEQARGPATPPPQDNLPGKFVAGSFSCNAGTRRYKLYIPAKTVDTARPLVVMLHGCTQGSDDFAVGTGMNAVAEDHGCLVLYPEQDSASNRSRCWNWFEASHQARGAGEPELLAAMTRHVATEQGADTARIFVAGLSAGGAMSAILGAEYPELFAAVGVHSGLAAGCAKDMMSGLNAMKKPGRARALSQSVPIIVFHGDGDHLVNAGNGDAVLQQYVAVHAKAQSAPLQVKSEIHAKAQRRSTQTVWCNQAGRAVAEHWVVHGAGHAWSGGNAGGSHTDPAGPSASGEMLRFFLQQKRANS